MNVRLTQRDNGDPVIINLDNMLWAVPDPNGTLIRTVGGSITVRESLNTIWPKTAPASSHQTSFKSA